MFIQLSDRGYHIYLAIEREDTIFIQLIDRGYHIYLAIREKIPCLFSTQIEDIIFI